MVGIKGVFQAEDEAGAEQCGRGNEGTTHPVRSELNSRIENTKVVAMNTILSEKFIVLTSNGIMHYWLDVL